MAWTDLVVLSMGLGIGAMGGWLVGRSRSSSNPAAKSSPSTLPVKATNDSAIALASDSEKIDSEKLNSEKLNSEKQALADQLQRTQLAYQMATEMAQFKAGFLARTSHELRSPINSVISLHQLILSDLCEDAAEEREFIAQSYAAAEKMLALLDRLIGIAKATQGTEQLLLQPLQLQEILQEIQQFTYLQAQNRNLRLTIEQPNPDLYVIADPQWLRQVLLSLVDTPIALMQEGNVRVTTQVSLEAKQVFIQIEDQRSPNFWTDQIDLLNCLKAGASQPIQFSISDYEKTEIPQNSPSPGLTLLMVQTLLELMGGRLEVLAVPSADSLATTEQSISPSAITAELSQQPSNLTRIQCSIPLAIPEP